ncbi:CAAD domain-containing protein [Nostoc sp. FACHB-110]|uniref:CAAD domain-containing protein n=1 Tax=Nostoc sp. FACHB-110 TaxID=2692834 RepID=UPI00168A3D5E|nr:CAAD domain-containing protein [Nostoc sp. FACHB-110]MBD2436035.1 CAAD domain-containing protein [Nostoc sp. FACHB-110]
METQIQQQEYSNPHTADNIMTVQSSEPGSLAKISKANAAHPQASNNGSKISDFWQQLPKRIVEFCREYQLQVMSFAVLVVMLVGLRFVVAVINTVNQLPVVATFFELVGIGYVSWFVSRYFLAENSERS